MKEKCADCFIKNNRSNQQQASKDLSVQAEAQIEIPVERLNEQESGRL